jgi:hypothetical protein
MPRFRQSVAAWSSKFMRESLQSRTVFVIAAASILAVASQTVANAAGAKLNAGAADRFPWR